MARRRVSMEIISCRSCGKIFNYVTGQKICPRCQKELEEKFFVVKKFIYSNPQAGMNEIAKECEVKTSQINRWIREERLAFSEDSPITMSCETCGAQIRTGRFCNKCKNDVQKNMSNAAGLNKAPVKPQKKERESNKMRFLNKE